MQEPRALLSSALAEAVRVGLVMCNRHLYAERALQVSAHRIKQNYCVNHDHSDWEPTTTGLGRKKSPTQSLSVWSAGRDTARARHGHSSQDPAGHWAGSAEGTVHQAIYSHKPQHLCCSGFLIILKLESSGRGTCVF